MFAFFQAVVANGLETKLDVGTVLGSIAAGINGDGLRSRPKNLVPMFAGTSVGAVDGVADHITPDRGEESVHQHGLEVCKFARCLGNDETH